MPASFDFTLGEGEELLPGQGSARLYCSVLDDEEAAAAMSTLLTTVPWQQDTFPCYGKDVPRPRLDALFGDPGRAYTYSKRTRQAAPWTDALIRLRERCEDLVSVEFNSVLANLYRNGNDYVDWHSDDEPDLGADPVIASLSLGTERRFEFRNKHTMEVCRRVLPAGSVVVMSSGCQQNWKHRLAKQPKIQEPRINLTFRTLLN